MKFNIVVPMYNVEEWVETTIQSVKEQNYKNFNCVVIDDISTDDSHKIVADLIADDSRFTLIKNTEKKFALRNIVEGIESLNPDPEDVVIVLDGDDWLANKRVLDTLKSYYSENDIWMTYGNHTNWPDGEPYWPLFPYPDEIIEKNNFRNFRFLASHLRSFKYKLWKEVNLDDLKDGDEFYQTAGDLAAMYPMLEMSGKRSMFIKETLYVYNNKNPLNDYKVFSDLQKKTDMKIRMKKKYKLRENL